MSSAPWANPTAACAVTRLGRTAQLVTEKTVVFQMCTLPPDMPCGGLLLKKSERGSCLALPLLSH
jgi:hypothetical protein